MSDGVNQTLHTEPGREPPAGVVGRLAPSPTGPLHLGHARSFLAAYWHARRANGRLVLRQEDLDGARSRQEFRDLVRVDLEWLGIEWDQPEWIQSEHVEGILAAAEQLVEQGDAYPCVCSRGDVQAVAAPHAGDVQAVYAGTCRGCFTSVNQAEQLSGRAAGIRARVRPGIVRVRDGVYGEIQQDLEREVGDFLIVRRDKTPAYQLAVAVDDFRQGVTAVVRGSDLLDSTPRQLFLHRILGLEPPAYFHLPLVVNERGERLAKRAKGLSIQELRYRGVDPRRIVAWVAQSFGIEVSGAVTAREVSPRFEITSVPRSPVTCPYDW